MFIKMNLHIVSKGRYQRDNEIKNKKWKQTEIKLITTIFFLTQGEKMQLITSSR